MKQHKKYIKMNHERKQIHITEQPPTFLSLKSSELKYMFPWALYDDISYKSLDHKTQKIENKESIAGRKIKKIQINNHESEMDFVL